MERKDKDELEQHLFAIRTLAARANLTSEQGRAVALAGRFAIALLKKHIVSGHSGKPCFFAAVL